MRPLPAVLIARYLVATGRRAAAIAELTDRSEPWFSPEQLFEELDVLDAVDALGEIARDPPVTDYHWEPLARALGRRRRFDLLRPLLAGEWGSAERGAIRGLWEAPAVADDSVLVRDWLISSHGAVRSECAQFLALVGDRAMACVLVDGLQPTAADPSERAWQLAWLAPAAAAIGDRARANAALAEAGSGTMHAAPLAEALGWAAQRADHVDALARDRSLPWNPMKRESFDDKTGRDRSAVDYALDARDLPRLTTTFSLKYHPGLPGLLAAAAERIPRAWIDREIAAWFADAAIAHAAFANDVGGDECVVSVIGALAEAGHLEAARALLPHAPTPNAYARLGAHTRDRAMIARALAGDGAALELAKFVDADLSR